MVKNSLRKMLDKYPYFLDKRENSNLYKVTTVNNSVFRDLYNNLFHLYQSFHLNKRLLIWKTQHRPYSYRTSFRCGYDNIKLVEIYKNDVLIHKEEFTLEEAEEKTKNNQWYEWDYICNYVKTTMLPIKTFKCNSCDNIYFGDEIPESGLCENCNTTNLVETKIFQCNNCNEYYFANGLSDLSINNNEAGYEYIQGYKCYNCGELYETLPEECEKCEHENFETLDIYKCNICGELFEEPPIEEPIIENNEYYTEAYAFQCLGNRGLNENVELSEYVQGHDETDCGEIYIGSEPPAICEKCGATSLIDVDDLYYNVENIMMLDNSTDFNTADETIIDDTVEISVINDDLLVSPEKKLFINVIDNAGNKLNDVTVKLYNYQHYEQVITDSLSPAHLALESGKHYTNISVTKNGYVSKYGETTYLIDLNGEFDNPVQNFLITVTLYPVEVINALNTFEGDEDVEISPTELESNEFDVDDDETLKIPIPVIPDDKFLFHVETWEEYWIDKGYPENDEYMGNEYDHDYSLDEIGKMNNIPRKSYFDVADKGLYPLTEPPYNNDLSEDDYHYMNRMIEYNLRLAGSLRILEEGDEDYINYILFLQTIGITEGDYDYFKKNMKLFRQRFNPVTLELWKMYGVDSVLINREKDILKLFDLRKHNADYLPYEVDENGNPVKSYKSWELDKDGNPIEGVSGSYVYKDKWEVVDELSDDWIPNEWEHKDKFCDGSTLYKSYFFVETSTKRPLPYESVYCKFKLMNSLAENVTDDYHVYLEYYRDNEEDIKPVNGNIITDGFCYIKYTMFSNRKPTIIRFNAYKTDYSNDEPYRRDEDNFIGSVDIKFELRTSCNADIYVDESKEIDGDGSIDHPYNLLQTALYNVNRNLNVICLLSDVETHEPFFVPSSCSILGVRERDVETNCEIEQGVKKVPVIKNDTSKLFFNLIGNKNCNLKLVDLRLKYSELSSYIGFATWENNNRKLDDYETVMIQGGVVIIVVDVNKEEYFPSDIVKVAINLMDKNGKMVGNQKVELTFEDNEKIILEDDDGDGLIEYELFTNKLEVGLYDLNVHLNSDLYFNSSVVTKINSVKEPHRVDSDSPVVITGGYEPEAEIKVYIDGEYVETVTADIEGVIEYPYTVSDWATHVLLFVNEDDEVIDMVIDEAIIHLSELAGQKFIKNVQIAINGDMTYDEVYITQNSTLSELDGVLIDFRVVDNSITETNVFHVKNSRMDEPNLVASEFNVLKNALIDINYKSNEDIEFTRIGEWWRD